MEEDQKHQELELLPSPSVPSSDSTAKLANLNSVEGPSLDLQLSISFKTVNSNPKDTKDDGSFVSSSNSIDALKWQAAEQFRVADMEKAYAERVRELSRREMELAHAEFARAKTMWESARQEVEKAEKLKESAMCMEITCNYCSQKF